MRQEEYLKYIADKNLDVFLRQGYATAGHNGPHGHPDTPARNTAHYLVIYSYLYKKTGVDKYKKICDIFASYLYDIQAQSKSGAVKCMETDRFDHLNGLIGQGGLSRVCYITTMYLKRRKHWQLHGYLQNAEIRQDSASLA